MCRSADYRKLCLYAYYYQPAWNYGDALYPKRLGMRINDLKLITVYKWTDILVTFLSTSSLTQKIFSSALYYYTIFFVRDFPK